MMDQSFPIHLYFGRDLDFGRSTKSVCVLEDYLYAGHCQLMIKEICFRINKRES